MTASRDPVRLHARLDRSSTLGQALKAAQAAGPDEQELKALERSVLACVGSAAVATTAITAVAAAKAPVAGAAAGAGAATGLSAGPIKLVLAAVSLAAVTGGTTLVWQATRTQATQTIARPSAPSARVQPAARPEATPAQPTSPPPVEQPATEPMPALAPPAPRPMPAVVQPKPRTVPASPRAPQPGWSAPALEPGPAPAAPATAQPAGAPYAGGSGHARTADVDDEIPLIKRAHRALTSDPALALALALEHTRRFPQSSLDQEREFIAITALVDLGRIDHARTQALHFVNRHPDSAYNGQIQKMVQSTAK